MTVEEAIALYKNISSPIRYPFMGDKYDYIPSYIEGDKPEITWVKDDKSTSLIPYKINGQDPTIKYEVRLHSDGSFVGEVISSAELKKFVDENEPEIIAIKKMAVHIQNHLSTWSEKELIEIIDSILKIIQQNIPLIFSLAQRIINSIFNLSRE